MLLATCDEVAKIISESSKTSCPLDPMPTKLLINLLPELLPVITHIVNLSLTTGIFPDALKTALVYPLIKKLTLDPNLFKSFRPVSHLSFLSKIIEKIIAKRLLQHLIENDLLEQMQSAYKPCHSTETALLKVQNDILGLLDKGQCVYLALLDLSAAFDTVDHEVLLEILESYVGIEGPRRHIME